MHTLLLRLAGPMQAWGTQSRFTERDTGLEPSKSGVIGLLCAALGRERTDPVDDLAALTMAVRVDIEGVVRRDFQTVLDVAEFGGKVSGNPVVSNRAYLAGADFLVGLEGSNLELLRELDQAVRRPVWQLALGRKAFVPALPIGLPRREGYPDGVRSDTALVEALRAEPWQRNIARPPWEPLPQRLRVVRETSEPRGASRRLDQPGPGAAFAHRRFLPRFVVTEFWPLGAEGVPIDGD